MKETFEEANRHGASSLKNKTMSLATGLNKLTMSMARRPSFGSGDIILSSRDC